MANEQIEIESLSPTPVQTDEQPQEEQPQRTLTPFDATETVSDAEVNPIERTNYVDQQNRTVKPEEVIGAAQAADPSLPAQEPVNTGVDSTPPPIPPGRYMDRAKTAKSDEELIQMGTETADFYRNQVLGMGKGDKAVLQRRLDAINNATYYRVPKVDENGNIFKDDEGNVAYISQPISFASDDEDMRVLQMFEFASSNNGVYHMFGADDKPIGSIDIGLQRMQRDKQGDLGKFLSRREGEKGGMRNYIRVLRAAGFKNPTDLVYMARQQAESDNIFSGVEWTRTKAQGRDTAKFFADIGYGEGFQVPFTDTKVGFGKPLRDFTLGMPIYLASTLGFADLPEGISTEDAADLLVSSIDLITKGKFNDYTTFDDSVDALHKQYPHVTKKQIEAFLTYSPDLQTALSRFALDSVVFGGSITGGMRMLGRAERMGFVEHVREMTDTPKLGNIGDAIAALEKKGMDASRVLREYYDKRGVSNGFRNMAAKALDMDVHHAARRPGPFFDNVIKPKLDDAQNRLNNVEAKLVRAYADNKSPKLIRSLQAQRDLLEKDILNYRSSSFLPPYARNFLVDEGIATISGSVAYQAMYEYGGNDPTHSSMAAFVTSVMTALPRVRGGAAATVEDVRLALSQNGEELATSRAAVKIRRTLEKAPPEMREQILRFMEDKAVAVEELSAIRFPPGHPRAGQPVIPEDALDQSFAHMSGLLTLRRLEKDLAESSLNIQKDAGKLSEGLFDLERNFMQQTKLVDAMAQHLDSLRYYRFSDFYNPNSETGKIVDTLIEFYDGTKRQLGERQVMLTDALKQQDRDLNKFFAGQLDLDDMEGLIDGTTELSHFLTLDRARYMDANVAPDADLDTRLKALQSFYTQVNAKVNDAFEANSRFTFNSSQADATSNRMFRTFLTKEESRAYGKASAMFDSLRANPLYKDARMDVTEVLDAFVAGGADGNLGLNTRGLQEIMPIYGEGTQTSRFLANLNLPDSTSRALTRLFSEAAGEYLDDFSRRIEDGPETLAEIFDDAGLDEVASNLDKWNAVRDFFDNNKALFGDDFNNLYPRLGVAPDVFMHVVSSLGSSPKDVRGLAARQLRESLLDRAPTDFFDNFYGSKSERNTIEGFAQDYEKTRKFYKDTYVTPFREQSSVVKRLARSPETTVRRNALGEFLKEVGAADEGADLLKLRENFYEVLEGVTGGKIDVTTDTGKQIRAILTKHVQAEIARLPASKAIRDRLIRDYGEGKALVRPEDVQEIQRELSGTKNTLLNNLFRRDANGEYLFRDMNGEPLVDPAVLNTNSFDELVGYGFREAEEAVQKVRERISDQAEVMKRSIGDKNTEIGGVIDARKEMVKRLGQGDGLGSQIIKLGRGEGGIERIAQMREDYIYRNVQEGFDSNVSAANFDQAVREATLDHIFDQVMKPGADMPYRTVDPSTGEVRMVVQKGADLDLQALGKVLGVTGETVSDSRQAGLMRNLLGDEVYDHALMVHNQLFNFEPKNQGSLLVTGKSIPLSAESMLSRGTSFFRGVISLRWLISEAAIRNSREANYRLTKMMLGDPKVGREVMDMLVNRKFDLDKREPEFLSVLITEIAKFDALHTYAGEEGEKARKQPQQSVDNQMQNLMP